MATKDDLLAQFSQRLSRFSVRELHQIVVWSALSLAQTVKNLEDMAIRDREFGEVIIING